MMRRFMVAMLAGAAWLSGASGRPPSDRAGGQAGDDRLRTAPSRRGDPARAGIPERPPRRSPRAPSQGATNPIQGSGVPTPAGRGASIPNQAVGSGTQVQARGPSGRPATPLGNIRHRGPNPAVVAGPADPGKRNAGTIAGNQVHRRL